MDKFEPLSEDVQKAFTEAGAAAIISRCAATDASTEADKKFVADQRVI